MRWNTWFGGHFLASNLCPTTLCCLSMGKRWKHLKNPSEAAVCLLLSFLITKGTALPTNKILSACSAWTATVRPSSRVEFGTFKAYKFPLSSSILCVSSAHDLSQIPSCPDLFCSEFSRYLEDNVSLAFWILSNRVELSYLGHSSNLFPSCFIFLIIWHGSRHFS